MKKPFAILFKMIFIAVCLCAVFPAHAQQTVNPSGGFDMTGTPQWVKDLRRGEIIAFGTFPFTFFFTSFTIDTYRFATNNWDRRYAPWPIKSAGAVDMTRSQQMMTIGIAAGSSVILAVVDHIIVRAKRNRQQQVIQSLPQGTPIIIRRPAGGGETADEPGSAGESSD